MCLPNFRISVFAGLLLGAACAFSPFGWGATHPPLPELNLLLSFGFFGLVATAGVRTMQSWWRLTHPLRPFMIAFGIGQLLVLMSFSFSSLTLQNTSAHYQWTHHMTAILVGLCVLGGFALQETVRMKVQIDCIHDEPDESQHA